MSTGINAAGHSTLQSRSNDVRNTTSVNYDFDELIREARLQRSAAIAQGIVNAAIKIDNAIRSAFGQASSEKATPASQPRQRGLKSSLANGR